jgi:hypothetical protein
LTLSLLGAVPAAAQPAAPQVGLSPDELTPAQSSTAPVVLSDVQPASIVELHDRFVESTDDDSRRAVLGEISRAHPRTLRDIKSLFDIFTRFPQNAVRDAVMASVRRLEPADAALEPAFMEYLKLPESEARLFGINGAFRLRSLRALPLIQRMAERRFAFKSPGESPILSDKNLWWTQYESLSALAQWQGAQALPLLRRRAEEAPAVARLMAMYLWKESLPDFVKWAGSRGPGQELAQEALTASVSAPQLRAARPEMLRLLRDRKANRELRHQLALKVGVSSTAEEIDSLLAEQAAAKDPETQLTLAAALFASRSPRTVPWLKKLSAEDPDPQTRLGALMQLRLLLPAAEVRPLLEAAASHDPDADNRQSAGELLKAPPPQP